MQSDPRILQLQWRVAELLAHRCRSFSCAEDAADTRAWWASVAAAPGEAPPVSPPPGLECSLPVPALGGGPRAVAHTAEGEEEYANVLVMPLATGQTTVVVKNLSGRYTMEDLLQLWPVDLTFDFMHVPYHLLHRRPLGFVFINFLSHELALAFQQKWHGKQCLGAKPLEVCAAEVQGWQGNMRLIKHKRLDVLEKVGFLPFALKGTVRLDARAIVSEVVEARTDLRTMKAKPLGAPEVPGSSNAAELSHPQPWFDAKASSEAVPTEAAKAQSGLCAGGGPVRAAPRSRTH